MARKGKQAVRNGGLPAWLLVVAGIILGGFGMWLIMRTGHMPISRPDTAPQATDADSGAGIAANPQAQESRYDFYSVLPEKEVVIPDAQLDAQAKAEQARAQQAQSNGTAPTGSGDTATAAPASQQGSYLLLAGSFTTNAAAERRKAELALKGFRAHIEPVTVHGQTLHRVLLGPYTSASKLEADKQQLDDGGIHAIAMKKR